MRSLFDHFHVRIVEAKLAKGGKQQSIVSFVQLHAQTKAQAQNVLEDGEHHVDDGAALAANDVTGFAIDGSGFDDGAGLEGELSVPVSIEVDALQVECE